MLDTNVFNGLVDGQVDVASLPKSVELFATHVQLDELKSTPNEGRRADLLAMFAAVGPKAMPTESAVWDFSRWGEAKWSDGVTVRRMVARLDELKKRDNNHKDALIAETAIANGFGLVTNDRNLATMAREFGGQVVSLAQFLAGEVA